MGISQYKADMVENPVMGRLLVVTVRVSADVVNAVRGGGFASVIYETAVYAEVPEVYGVFDTTKALTVSRSGRPGTHEFMVKVAGLAEYGNSPHGQKTIYHQLATAD